MKKVVILSVILGLLCCNSKEDYLKKHDVVLCYTFNNNEKLTEEALDFEKQSKIKIKDASNIYTDFLIEKTRLQKKILLN
ncbi:hypothetical protein [Flavobacterium sp. H122]|uniref:hypothetical protein n=1 Tax=Flavobacterium sp. H122 TaxID=2529860 RepID=UPI0010AA3270|nr:hypothetical protein [Flavobacterium sp. H122]